MRDVPSVIYGTTTFDPATRRVPAASYKLLLVKGGQFTVWDGPGQGGGLGAVSRLPVLTSPSPVLHGRGPG